ncbi:MAG: bifunctional diguanylate cyclase/phosphodiesterase, partial [Sandaracinaceae bacterium]|nr:bifunctional diguanylate cyclase/phosphodiesterase [Sandaracinaceae bacterium]
MSSPRPTAHLDKEDPPLRHSGIIEPPGLSDRLEEGSDLSLVLSDGQNLCTLFESAPIAIVLQDSDGRIICSNHAFSELVGVERAELKGQSLAPLLVTEDLPQWESHLHKINEGINRWSDFKTQLRLFRTDGRLRYCSVASKVLSDAQGKKYLLSLLLDETERREIERRLRHETYHDRMTGLPNRTLFLDRLGQALLQDVSGAVLVIGLDRMRSINDAFGHAVGDRVIVEVARRLKATVQRTDTVARIGGDEFAVLLIGTNREAAFEAIHAAARPVLYPDGRELVVTASMGIRELRGLEAPELVLGDAILALQRAKELGRNRTVFYEPFLRGRASRTAEIARNLREAIGRREFDIEYQPIHASSDGRLVGFEALARWKRSALGVISPGEFVPVAEERGLIQLIGAYVLGESLAQLERWRRIHPLASGLSVSVNLSPVQVR